MLQDQAARYSERYFMLAFQGELVVLILDGFLVDFGKRQSFFCSTAPVGGGEGFLLYSRRVRADIGGTSIGVLCF